MAWTDADMAKPWGAEVASLRHLAADPALNVEQSAMLRHCAKRIESTALVISPVSAPPADVLAAMADAAFVVGAQHGEQCAGAVRLRGARATVVELIDELAKADAIIAIALNALTGADRNVFIVGVTDAGLGGDGVTRANERAALLGRVGGAA